MAINTGTIFFIFRNLLIVLIITDYLNIVIIYFCIVFKLPAYRIPLPYGNNTGFHRQGCRILISAPVRAPWHACIIREKRNTFFRVSFIQNTGGEDMDEAFYGKLYSFKQKASLSAVLYLVISHLLQPAMLIHHKIRHIDILLADIEFSGNLLRRSRLALQIKVHAPSADIEQVLLQLDLIVIVHGSYPPFCQLGIAFQKDRDI